jgi:CPA2 family monovalent cation:H+ antiporter-2
MQFEASLFNDIVIIFVAAFVGGALARMVRLPTLLGYMVVGAAVGPHALGIISNVDAVRTLAEVGVVLLLFAVGVELSPADLRQMGRRVVVAGSGQLVITGAAGFLAGLALGWELEQAAILGMVLSLSSTMVVLKTLGDRGELQTVHGRVMTGMLVMQDLAFIPMIAVIPALAGEQGSLLADIGLGALKAAAVLSVVFIVGGRVIPLLLRRAALFGTRESFIVTVVAISFGGAAITQSVGLSAALGAFAAGLVIRVSDWTGHRALQEVTPLRDIFAAMFFASLGMLTDPGFIVDNIGLVGLVIALSIGVKFLLVGTLVRLVGYLPRTALLSGVGMIQLGEFSFILAGTATAAGVVDESFLPLVVVVAVSTMAITPGAISGGTRLVLRLERRYAFLRPYLPGRGGSESMSERMPRLRGHVVVAGLGRVGSFIADELHRQGLPFIGIDEDPASVERVHDLYGHALLGDSASEPVLDAARIRQARLLVVAISEPVSALVTVQHARRMNPTLHIVGRVGWRAEAEALHEAGAEAVVWPEMEAALEIMRLSLTGVGLNADRVEALVSEARSSLEYGRIGPVDRPDPYAGLW